MAKEEGVAETPQEDANKMLAAQVAMALNAAIQKPGGLPMRIVGEQAHTFRVGEVSKVTVCEVWTYFTFAGCGFRTATKADRDLLLQGITSISCVRLSGTLKPPVAESEPKRKPWFIPRSGRSLLPHGEVKEA